MTSKRTRWWLPGLLCLVLGPALADEVPIHDCDRLAAHPQDSNKVGPGVHWNLLDPERAVPACEAAVRDFPQVPRFGYQYARSLLKKGDDDAAFRLYRDLAEQGYPAAQSTLGHLYYSGQGVPQDDAEAVTWFRKAADQGHADAQNNLGAMLENGQGVPPASPVMAVVLVLSAVVPALLLMWYFWTRDAYPEPPRVVWTTFGLGVFSVVLVVPVEMLVVTALEGVADPWAAGLGTAFLAAAIPEGVAKFCILFFYCLRHTEFDEPMDGLVYGAAASMGFAAVENLAYVYEGGLGVAAMRAVTAVPMHAMHGAIMGYFLALYRFLPARRGIYLLNALAIPVLLHGLYDFPLMTADLLPEEDLATNLLFVGTLAVLSAELAFVLTLLRRVRTVQAQRAEDIEAAPDYGVLDAYHAKGAPRLSMRAWLFLLLGGLLAWVGAVAVIGIAVATVADEFKDGGPGAAVLGLGFSFVIAVLGIVLFRNGVARLNRAPAENGRSEHR